MTMTDSPGIAFSADALHRDPKVRLVGRHCRYEDVFSQRPSEDSLKVFGNSVRPQIGICALGHCQRVLMQMIGLKVVKLRSNEMAN